MLLRLLASICMQFVEIPVKNVLIKGRRIGIKRKDREEKEGSKEKRRGQLRGRGEREVGIECKLQLA